MASAALLRKTLRSILQEKLIPELSGSGTPSIAFARFPPLVPPGIEVREMPGPLLKMADARLSPNEGDIWDEVRMDAQRIPMLIYVVEGEIECRLGLTDAMLPRNVRKHHRARSCGGYVLTLPQSTFFLRPAHIPQSMDSMRGKSYQGPITYFTIRILPSGALCSMATVGFEDTEVSYSLLLDDDQLTPITEVLINELSMATLNIEIARALLLSLILRLERGMNARTPPPMVDGMYSRFPITPSKGKISSPLEHPLIQKIHAYIQLHLHQPLTPADIANHVRLTPVHVNRVLRQHTGMSTMAYVTHLRLEAAQLLLDTSEQSVEEIAHLVGFQRVSHFSTTFQHFCGVSPLKFRQLRPPLPTSVRGKNFADHLPATASRPKKPAGNENSRYS